MKKAMKKAVMHLPLTPDITPIQTVEYLMMGLKMGVKSLKEEAVGIRPTRCLITINLEEIGDAD